MKENYTVYRHRFPNGKVYVGMTSQEPELRWDNGRGYEENRKMFSAILEFGWRNISHEIIASGLSEEEARERERREIESYGDDAFRITFNKHWVRRDKREWFDDPWNTAIIGMYYDRLKGYRDDWIDRYSPSGMYLDLRFFWNRVILVIEGRDGRQFFVKRIVLLIPEYANTVKEVFDWLNSGPDPIREDTLTPEQYWFEYMRTGRDDDILP